VDFAAIDATCIAAGLPAGRLTYGDWFRVMPYADTVRICTITGAQLARLLHDNALRIDRPEEAHTERGFLHFSRAVRYASAWAMTRARPAVVAATVDGRPLAEQQERASFRWRAPASCTRRRAPGSGRPATGCASLFDPRLLPKEDTSLFVRNELVAFIRAQGGVTAAAARRRDGRLVVEE
jgi:5'-nucleotidase/UDP-sugar diphosphatase